MPSPAENLALSIVRKLQAAGHTAYFAGGCVRDRLMNATPKDFDVATSALPDQVLALFPRSQQVGAAFGVILVRERTPRNAVTSPAPQSNAGILPAPPPHPEFVQVEVATFRADGTYSDGRHPDSVHFTTAEKDAQRRDFTCNGLFFDPLANNAAGQLHDFVGGQSDIQKKILRAIGNPEARFNEDHLRMLRAVRFAARLGFAIDDATLKAMREHSGNIHGISKERIGEELRLMLEHPSRAKAADMLLQVGLFEEIWPDIRARDPNSWHTLSALTEPVSRSLGLAAIQVDFLHGHVDLPWHTKWHFWGEALCDKFVLSNKEHDDFIWIGQTAETLRLDALHLTRAQLKRLMSDARWNAARRLFEAWSRSPNEIAALHQREAQMRDEGVAPVPFITGDTLIKLGAKPSPKFRALLDTLYDRQLNCELTTLDQALAAAKKLIEP